MRENANGRTRGYCFTWNNPPDDYSSVLDVIDCRYIVAGEEVAPTTGTRHLQGYVYFRDTKTVAAVRRILRGCHVKAPTGPLNKTVLIAPRREKPMKNQMPLCTHVAIFQWTTPDVAILNATAGRLLEMLHNWETWKTFPVTSSFATTVISGGSKETTCQELKPLGTRVVPGYTEGQAPESPYPSRRSSQTIILSPVRSGGMDINSSQSSVVTTLVNTTCDSAIGSSSGQTVSLHR